MYLLFKWNLSDRTFAQYYLFLTILRKEIWIFWSAFHSSAVNKSERVHVIFFNCFCVGISSFHHPSSREGRIWKGAWTVSRNTQESSKSNINPLSHNINIKILQTDLHTFPLRISREHLIRDQGISSLVIILYILITWSLDIVWILLGESWCWTLLELKGLMLIISKLFYQSSLWTKSYLWMRTPPPSPFILNLISQLLSNCQAR